MQEPELERQGRRLGRPGWWFRLIGIVIAIPGVLLLIFTHSWAFALGIVLLALGAGPAVLGLGLLLSSIVAHWSARHKLFA